MPRAAWSAKRERQYDHIKTGLMERGKEEDEAEEIAARTVNKVRAQEGESVEASAASLNDLSPSRRGGLRSHSGAKGRTHRELYEEARAKGITGRSSMSKAQLERALDSR
jgi:plasmid stabilization system protein ParE